MREAWSRNNCWSLVCSVLVFFVACMESSPTDLYLPQSLPYPIKLTSLDATPNSTIKRGTRLLSYSFIHFSNGTQETRFGTWDSAIEGDLHSWLVKVGDVITQNKANERPAVVVIEPCKHGIQLGGLCVLCGKDMTRSVALLSVHQF